MKTLVKKIVRGILSLAGIEIVRERGSVTLRSKNRATVARQTQTPSGKIRWSSAPVVQPSFFDRRCYDVQIILDHLNLIKQRHAGEEIFILTDTDLPGLDLPVIDCRKAGFGISSFQNIPHSVFYCVFDSDQLAVEILGAIADAKGIFYPPPISYPVASYFHFNDVAREVLKNELEDQRREGFDKWDCGPGDMINLIQTIEITRNLDGSFVEIGTYRGSSASVALRYMKATGIHRESYFIDVFCGFDYEEAHNSPDRMWVGTHSTEGRNAVHERLSRHAARGQTVHVIQANIIRDSLPQELERIAVANIDVDMYEAVQAALNKVAPLMVGNGIMIVEDAGHTPALIGARLALTRFLKSAEGAAFLPLYMESGQTLLIRR